MTTALHILRSLGDVVAIVLGAAFAIGAVCGAGAVLVAVGLFDKWDRAERKS